jgi:Capsule assembly protein Wzi
LSSTSLVLVTSDSIDRERSYQLREGVPVGHSLLLRSSSSLTGPLQGTPGRWRATLVAPQFLAVTNSSLPFSQNNGALWAGRGLSTRTLTGVRLERGNLRIILAPEFILSANANWPLFQDYYHPPVPAGYSPFYFPYYVGQFTIDQPMRFGDRAIHRIDLGQTSILTSIRSMEVGFSNENEWWGPGIRNAIVLSNNAPGFPHLFVRTAHPVATRLGDIEMRWLVGGLTESAYFDTISTNNSRSLSAIAASLQTKWDPNLSFGVARSVYGTETGGAQFLGRWFDVFARTHRDVPDTTRTQRDQLFTLFSRWVFPADGVEIYGEWGRTQLRPSLRDFLIAPNHTQGYTLGLQWRGANWREGSFRVQTEITQLEQSATFRDEPLGSWYTSTRVIQGYTNRGEMLGASIGPGASSQWLALDYLKPGWQLGAFVGRIRWNQDVHNHAGLPIYESYCSMDLSLYPGVRGAKQGQFGSVTAELSLQDRLTPFFQNGGGCPNNGRRLDIRNNSLSITFSPFSRG